MSDRALVQPSKTSAYLLTFMWGSKTLRLTDWTNHIRFLGRSYLSTPKIELQIPESTGGLEEPPWVVRLPRSGFSQRISSGQAHAPVSLVIREYIVALGDSSGRVIFEGTIQRARRNPSGKRGTVELRCETAKDRLETKLGMPATPDCPWIFGNPDTCGIDLGPLRESATVRSIDGSLVTLQGLTTTAVSRYWHRGFLELDGLIIGIHDYETGDVVRTYRQAPYEWLGAEVTMTPGCDKSVDRCKFWNNESEFGGCGIAIPEYNPIIETGGR